MRILLVSPYFPPDRGGVSDHSFILARELSRQGHTVAVLTYCRHPSALPGVSVITIPREKGGRALRIHARQFRPDSVLVQFTPLSFAEKFFGIAPWLPWQLLGLKIAARCPVHLFAHETHYPVRLSKIGLAVGIPHFLQFTALALLARQIFFSHRASLRFWQRLLPWRRADFSVVPVPSNIEKCDTLAPPTERLGLPEGARTLLYFGGAHDMNLLDFVVDSHRHLVKKFPREKIYLVMAGVKENEVRRRVPQLDQERVIVTGYLPAREISGLLRASSFVLAPFGEGINTRRGSAMAALLHGKALLTTTGWCTGDDHPWEAIAACSDAGDKATYLRNAEALFADEARALEIGRAASAYYEENFSSAVAAERISARLRAAIR